MPAIPSPCISGRAPLLGHNLVRLLYLDEGGSDHRAPVLSVAGVLVHGDNQWPEIDRRILQLINKYVAPSDRLGFVFHATDIYHGSRYFDRRKPEWNTPDKRLPVINDLAAIIDDLHLPVVSGSYKKEQFGAGIEDELRAAVPEFKGKLIHNAAAIDCLIRADRWLANYAPSELGTVIHEDGTPAKRLIKRVVRTFRSTELLKAEGFSTELQEQYGVPLKRIIDTVHFAEKADARPLQLADLCAFILARGLKNLAVPEYAFDVVWRHMRWFFKLPLPAAGSTLS